MTVGGSEQKSTSDHRQAVTNGRGTLMSEDTVVECVENGKPETTLVKTHQQGRNQEQATRAENEERERGGTLVMGNPFISCVVAAHRAPLGSLERVIALCIHSSHVT